MGLFSNLFGRKADKNGAETLHQVGGNAAMQLPDDAQPRGKQGVGRGNHEDVRQDNIHSLYDFLGRDFEQQGYNDALVNPDSTYMQQNVEAILSDLDMVIRRVKTFYEDTLREFDFLIETRSRSGMIDTVEEIKMKKQIAESHTTKVQEMEQEAKSNLGVSQRLVISYKRGFGNGIAAIAHHEMNKRKF